MVIAVFEVAFDFVGRGFLLGAGARIFPIPSGASPPPPASSPISLGPDWHSESKTP